METVLVKRRALFPNEIGLFPSNPMAGDDIETLTLGEEVMCKISSPRNLQLLKYLWALATKVADNSDAFLDKDHCMDELKLRAAHSRVIFNSKTNKLEVVPKSLTRINNERLKILSDRMIKIVCDEIIPGMEENALRKEIEAMCS